MRVHVDPASHCFLLAFAIDRNQQSENACVPVSVFVECRRSAFCLCFRQYSRREWMAFFLTAGLGNPHLSKRADSHQVQEEKRDFTRLTGMASRATHACWRSPSSEPWVNGAHARRPAGHGCICAKMFRKDIIYMQLRCPSTARVLS